MLFWPATLSLFTHNMLWTHCVLAWPIERLGGPVLAANCYYLFSFWLSAFGAYLLISRFVDNRGAALLGGAIYAFCPYITAHALGHYGLIAVGWIPLLLYALLRTLEDRSWCGAALTAATFIAVCYTDYTVMMFSVMLASGWILLQGPARWRDYIRGGAIPKLLAAGVVAVAAVGPYFIAVRSDPSVKELLDQRTWNSAGQYGAAFAAFFIPSTLHSFWGHAFGGIMERVQGAPADKTVYLGWTVLLLSGIALRFRRGETAVRTAAILALVFILLSMGPTLHLLHEPIFKRLTIDDAVVTPGMPFTLLHFVPPLRQLRLPARFAIIGMLMLAVLGATGLAALQEQLKKSGKHRLARLVLPMAALLVLADFVALPFHTASADVPPIYRQLDRLPAKSAVLDLPFGCKDGLHGYGDPLDVSLYYQTIDHRPIIGGYIARLPWEFVRQYQQVPLLDTIAAGLEHKPYETQEITPAAAEADLERLRIGIVVIHREQLDPALRRWVRSRLTRGRWEHQGNLDIYSPSWIPPNSG
jgi:hypothetical protein